MPKFSRTATTPRSFELQPLGRATLLDKIYIGFVKKVYDNQQMGRLKVYIPEIGGDPGAESSWITVRYASPFAGATNLLSGNKGSNYKDSQQSYGMWFVPPDLENEVLVCFINGDPGKGIWFACLYQSNMNHMVPGLAGNQANNGLPVGEYNKNITTTDPNNPTRPEYSPLADALKAQGLDQDTIRGVSNSSARRTSPPNSVYGLLTPGGSQIVFDDGEGNKFIRLRTQSGVQLLLNDTTGEIYMITSQGENWFSMTADGQISLYASKDITIRTEQSLNLRADLDVNIEAGRNMNIKARGESSEGDASGQGQIRMSANNDMHLMSGQNFFATAGNTFNRTAQNDIRDTAKGDADIKAAGSIFVQSNGGDVDIKARAEIHATSTNIHLNSVPAGDATAATDAQPPEDITLVDASKKTGTWQQTSRTTIVYNLTYHEPYNHNSSTSIPKGDIGTTNVATDPLLQIIRDGEVGKNQDVPNRIIGTPKAGMQPGIYEGVGYDDKGNPVYKYIGGSNDLNAIGTYTTSQNGINFIKATEVYAPNKYPDPPGQSKRYSVGFGHLMSPAELSGNYVTINNERIYLNRGLTRTEADALFSQDLKPREDLVKKAITAKITQSQFDALVSFTYNIGHIEGTSVQRAVNAGDFQAVNKAFLEYVKAGTPKVTNPGLVKRRQKELAMFMSSTKAPSP